MRLMSRAMYAQISAQNSWFSNFYLEDSVVEELVFWQSNLDHLNGRRIWFKSSAVRVAYSDASDTGYGGYIVELGPQVAAQGVWSADLAKESFTMLEILAVGNVLLRQQLGLSTTSPCSADSEAYEVLLRTRYFDRSVLAFTYNGRFSSGSFC